LNFELRIFESASHNRGAETIHAFQTYNSCDRGWAICPFPAAGTNVAIEEKESGMVRTIVA
jgi:hypothetical protein